MGPKVKEERGHQSPPIRMVLRVVVKLTGAGGESRSPPTIGVTGAGSYTAVWSLSIRVARRDPKSLFSPELPGWTEGPASPALCPMGEGHMQTPGPRGRRMPSLALGPEFSAPFLWRSPWLCSRQF
jgi:hypothetical protein